MKEERVTCKTPTPGKKPTTIPKWKYALLKKLILQVIGRGKNAVEFRELPGLIRGKLKPDEIARLGSVSWHVTTVKLDLETRGELERIAGSNPQRLRRK